MFLISKMNVYSSEYSRFQSLAGIYMTFFCMLTANTLEHSPRRLSLRVVVIFWAISSLNLYSLFSSELFSLLTSSIYTRLVTEGELLNSGLSFGIMNITAKYFTDRGIVDDETAKILQNHVHCEIVESCLNQVAVDRWANCFIISQFYKFEEVEAHMLRMIATLEKNRNSIFLYRIYTIHLLYSLSTPRIKHL